MLNTADEPDDIEFVSYHDKDDLSVYDYVGNHKEVISDRLYNYSQMWNECQKIATGPYFMYQADDILFETKGWDTKIKDSFNKVNDKILFVCFNDQVHSEGRACIYCVHKNWVDAVGYLTPPYFSSHLPDNWVNDVAKGVGRRLYLKDILIRHNFINDDATHTEYVKRRADEPPWEIYKKKKKERKHDIELLQKFIKNYGA